MDQTRILKEIEDIYRDPPDNISAGPIDDNDLLHWEAVINGPDDTDYKDGVFLLDIKIPKEYPFKKPICKFKTRMYHPNINKDTGAICLNILNNWNPSLTISNVLMSIMLLLYTPNFSHGLNQEAIDLHKKSEDEYKQTVRKWVKENSGKENWKYQ